jgi:hypothetical protein
MKTLAKSLNVCSSVFLKSYRVDSETKEGVLHDVVWALSGVATNALCRAFPRERYVLAYF